MWYSRYYESIEEFLQIGKVNLIYGPRRVGKTSLVDKLLSKRNKIYIGTGDDLQLKAVLSSEDKSRIVSAFNDYDFIFIDEAQRVENIGWSLKILIDHLPKTTVIASGSSSFQLSASVGSPLTGRSRTYKLYPISLLELKAQFGGMKTLEELNNYLIYGMYPEVLNQKNNQGKKTYLTEIRDAYLLRDVLELENIKNSNKLFDLLKLLAFQIGSEVSLNELGNSLSMSKHTVARYLDILEKAYIIKRLGGFSRNLRKEVIKSSRYYFYDNGIRNAIINNFGPIELRNDMGMLWENFAVMERLKKQEYHQLFSNNYFWRTYDQKEVDWVEERDGKLYGYEFKWNPRKIKIQKTWLETYPEASFQTITPDQILEFAC